MMNYLEKVGQKCEKSKEGLGVPGPRIFQTRVLIQLIGFLVHFRRLNKLGPLASIFILYCEFICFAGSLLSCKICFFDIFRDTRQLPFPGLFGNTAFALAAVRV